MFIFISELSCFFFFSFIIYIPLCLYLYVVYNSQVLKLKTHLHSTMFIFISGKMGFCCSCLPHLHSTMFIFIYILFWSINISFHNLHSTRFIFIWNVGMERFPEWFIYIPLCLYLYNCRK